MKIQVADIRADESRISQSHLRVHIGSIHIYLRSASMDNVADLFYFRFKYTVGGGISDHQRSQFLLVLFGFGAEGGHVNVALFVAGAGNGGETGLDGGSRVGAVRRSGYQYLVPVSLTYTFQIGTNNAKARIFSRSPRIRL